MAVGVWHEINVTRRHSRRVSLFVRPSLTIDITAVVGYTSDIHQQGVRHGHEDSEMGQQPGLAD